MHVNTPAGVHWQRSGLALMMNPWNHSYQHGIPEHGIHHTMACYFAGKSFHRSAQNQVCQGPDALSQQASQNEQKEAQEHPWPCHGEKQKPHQGSGQEAQGG